MRYKNAGAAYLQACRAGQHDIDACVELAGHSYYEQSEALCLLAIAQQLNSSDYRVYERLADVLCNRRCYDEAEVASTRALQLEPGKSWMAQRVKQKIEAMQEEARRARGNLQNVQSEYLRQGRASWNAWRNDHPAAERDFSYLELRGLDLQQADLSHLNLSQSDLSQSDLTGANLYAAILTGTTLGYACLASADAREISGSGAMLTGANLSGTNLYHAMLSQARLELVLRQGDAMGLATLDRSFAPFYCWSCHGCYCYTHMRFNEAWDDYYPYPDYWYGTCPYGHATFVDH